MADAPATKQPNRSLAMLLLLLTTFGTLAFVCYGTWLLFDDQRLPGFGWMSIGLLWFLFFSWTFRATLRPGPQG